MLQVYLTKGKYNLCTLPVYLKFTDPSFIVVRVPKILDLYFFLCSMVTHSHSLWILGQVIVVHIILGGK